MMAQRGRQQRGETNEISERQMEVPMRGFGCLGGWKWRTISRDLGDFVLPPKKNYELGGILDSARAQCFFSF
jgi:hypothetical protein